MLKFGGHFLLNNLLQERIEESGCSILNYVEDKIFVDYFYSPKMYEAWLEGCNCRQGMGLHDKNQKLFFNRIPDGFLVIVQENGKEIKRYSYKTIFEGNLEFKTFDKKNKKITAKRVLRIRKEIFSNVLDLLIGKDHIDFPNMDALKAFLQETYGEHFLTLKDGRRIRGNDDYF